MQLYVDHAKSEESVVFVRWCFSPKERLEIVRNTDVARGEAPQVLISVVAIDEDGYQREESRQVRPATEMATYISLRSFGRHIINAIYVGDRKEAVKFLNIECRHRDGSISFERNIYNRHEAPESNEWISHYVHGDPRASVEVEVDARSFATKPFDWKLVNHFFEAPPID